MLRDYCLLLLAIAGLDARDTCLPEVVSVHRDSRTGRSNSDHSVLAHLVRGPGFRWGMRTAIELKLRTNIQLTTAQDLSGLCVITFDACCCCLCTDALSLYAWFLSAIV